MKIQNFKITAILIAVFLFLVPVLSQAVPSWVEPDCNPEVDGPDACNVEAPINTSNIGQTKAGSLTLNDFVRAVYGTFGTVTPNSNYGISASGDLGGAYFENSDANINAKAYLAYNHGGLDTGVYGNADDIGGVFINSTNTITNVNLAYHDSATNDYYGIWAKGLDYGLKTSGNKYGLFSSGDNTTGIGLYSYGYNLAAEFRNSADQAKTYIAYNDGGKSYGLFSVADSIGLHAEGGEMGGYFKNSEASNLQSYLAYKQVSPYAVSYGIKASADNFGGYFYGNDRGLYASSIDTGVETFGANYGIYSSSTYNAGYFEIGESNYVKLGYKAEDKIYGVYSYAQQPGHFENISGSARAELAYDDGRQYGIYATGDYAGGYLAGENYGLRLRATDGVGLSSNGRTGASISGENYGARITSSAEASTALDITTSTDSSLGINVKTTGSDSVAINTINESTLDGGYAAIFGGNVKIADDGTGNQGYLILHEPDAPIKDKCLRIKKDGFFNLKWQWTNYFNGACDQNNWKDML